MSAVRDWGLFQIHHADCLDALRAMADSSVDSIVTDPPYGLTSARPTGRSEATEGAVMKGFMGLAWDGSVPGVDVWAECLRVLKPGGYLLAFAGTRTQHRMATRIEDAGFELRDLIAWVYGSGFPKGTDKAKIPDGWQGWNTALKPAFEPITMARKALIGTLAENLTAHGAGAINVDGCRVDHGGTHSSASSAGTGAGRATANVGAPAYGKGLGGVVAPPHDLGRWPANLIHDGSDEVLAAFPQAPGQIAAASSSSSRKSQNVYGAMARGNGRDGEPSADSDNEGVVGFKMKPGARRLDAGSAARFFYCAKASKSDRSDGNAHPTVKPTDLMRYLCRLVTPPGGLVLDPFMGSGSTGKAAMLEGFRFVGCEREAAYIEIAERRIALAAFGPLAFAA